MIKDLTKEVEKFFQGNFTAVTNFKHNTQPY